MTAVNPTGTSPSAFVRADCAETTRSRSPLTVQAQRPRAPRAMMRTSGIAELLDKYKATQQSTIQNMSKPRQELSESDGRMAAQRTAPERARATANGRPREGSGGGEAARH